MAVQQNRKSRSRRDMRRSHHKMSDVATLSIDKDTGEKHRRHQATKDGFYRGRQLFKVTDDE